MADKSIVQGNIDMKELLTPIQEKIIDTLKKEGRPMRRKQICEAFGFGTIVYDIISYDSKKDRKSQREHHRKLIQHKKRTTIHNNLDKLKRRKIVENFTKNNGKRGRPLVLWALVGV